MIGTPLIAWMAARLTLSLRQNRTGGALFFPPPTR